MKLNLKPLNACLSCASVIFGTVIAIMLLFLILHLIYGTNFLEYLQHVHGIFVKSGETSKKLSEAELRTILRMNNEGRLMSPDGLLEAMSEFYSTLITILIAIITVLGILAFMFILGVSKSKAEDLVNQEIAKLTDRKSFMDALATNVNKLNQDIINPIIEDYNNFTSENKDEILQLKTSVRALRAKLAFVEAMIAEKDNEENENPDGTLDLE